MKISEKTNFNIGDIVINELTKKESTIVSIDDRDELTNVILLGSTYTLSDNETKELSEVYSWEVFVYEENQKS